MRIYDTNEDGIVDRADAVNGSNVYYAVFAGSATNALWSLWSASNSNSIYADVSGTSIQLDGQYADYYTNLTNMIGLLETNRIADLADFISLFVSGTTNGIPESIVSGDLASTNYTISATNALSNYLPLGGGAMTGPIDMGANQISNVFYVHINSVPTDQYHAIRLDDLWQATNFLHGEIDVASNLASSKIADGDTLTNGLKGPTIYETNGYINIDYLNNRLGTATRYYLLNSTPSEDLAGYRLMRTISYGSNLSCITNAAVTNNQYLVSYVTATNEPEITSLLAGNYELHIHAYKGVVGTVKIFPEIYILSSNGAVKFETNSTLSTELSTLNDSYSFLFYIQTNIPMLITDRLSVKIKANVISGSPTIYVCTEDGAVSYFAGQLVSEATELDPKAIHFDGNISMQAPLRMSSNNVLFSPVTNIDAGLANTITWRSNSRHQILTLTNQSVFTFVDPLGACDLTLEMIQDATGGYTNTWPAGVKWPGGTIPSFTTNANAKDLIRFYFNGSLYYGDTILDLK